jgi:hypothetical protein
MQTVEAPQRHPERIIDRQAFLVGAAASLTVAAGIIGLHSFLGHDHAPDTTARPSPSPLRGIIIDPHGRIEASGPAAPSTVTGLPPSRLVKPSELTTGYRLTGAKLEPYRGQYGQIHDGVLTLSTPGVTVANFDIPARIEIRAADIAIRGCRVTGGEILPASNAGLISCIHEAVQRCIIEDSLLAPERPSLWWDGVDGHDFQARRLEIFHTVDGFGIFNTHNGGGPSGVEILECYVHDLSYFSPAPRNVTDAVPHTHNDCIQIHGNTGTVIRGNNLQGFIARSIGDARYTRAHPNALGGYNINDPSLATNSVLQVTQGVSQVRGVTFDSNWCDGGGVTLNISSEGGPTGTNFGSVSNNIFGRGEYYQGGSDRTNGLPGAGGDKGVVLWARGFVFDDTSGNVYEDNGHPIMLRIE